MHYSITINGLVQGVGFRPFIYQLATFMNLRGSVLNNSQGVQIRVVCSEENLDILLQKIQESAPPMSKIETILIDKLPLTHKYKKFKILQSESTLDVTAKISPDLGVCQECLAELNDEKNRRFKYPFISCVNCGPRYTLLQNLPYDRKNISMQKFPMCKKCQEEYENPLDRRYHSETIGCFECGMQLSLLNKEGKRVHKGEEIQSVIEALQLGEIVAIKGVGGYHLVCDSTNAQSISKLRRVKNRVRKPFAIMVENIEEAKKIAHISAKEEELLDSVYKPIVLLKKKEAVLLNSIAPNINQIGILLPYTSLHYLIMEKFQKPLAVTSANISGEPLAKNREDILILSNMWLLCLDNDREIENGCDDSVAFVENENTYMLRNARGYAPRYMPLKKRSKKSILAMGANQKSTIALVKANEVVISPYIGELSSLSSLSAFKANIANYKRFYNFEPELLICDKHPQYESTKYAKELVAEDEKVELIELQHHFAHALGAMGERACDEDFLAVIFDGLGYGDDGKLWGGEFFKCNIKKYERVAHLQEFKLIGATQAIREPRRIALSILIDMYGKEVFELKNNVISSFSTIELKALYNAHQKDINAPLTTSMGRVFDAVASMTNILQISDYEGESGLLLESYYDESVKKSYDFNVTEGVIELHTLFEALLKESDRKIAISKFFNTIVEIIVYMKKRYKLPVVVGGGVFQNRILLRLLKQKLPDIYLPKDFVSNDGAIAYGQAIAASASS